MFRSMIAAACVTVGVLAVSPAFAACSFKVLPIPVTMVGLRPTVPVKIGGGEWHFLIDSGSFTNAISVGLAADQNLLTTEKRRDSGGIIASQVISGVAGQRESVEIVDVPEVEFLATTFKHQAFAVSGRIRGLDGIIGQPMLRQMDVEYDLRGGVIRLVKTDGCDGVDMVYWAKEGQAYSKMAIEGASRYNPHTQGFIYINGQKMRAQFDTGATTTFITEDAAARAGVKLTDPGVKSLGKLPGLDGEIDTWAGTFAEVMIGDEAIKNTPLTIGRSKERDFDVLIGADFFSSHHVYVSNKQHQLFFAYDGGPVFLQPQPAPLVQPARSVQANRKPNLLPKAMAPKAHLVDPSLLAPALPPCSKAQTTALCTRPSVKPRAVVIGVQ